MQTNVIKWRIAAVSCWKVRADFSHCRLQLRGACARTTLVHATARTSSGLCGIWQFVDVHLAPRMPGEDFGCARLVFAVSGSEPTTAGRLAHLLLQLPGMVISDQFGEDRTDEAACAAREGRCPTAAASVPPEARWRPAAATAPT